MKRCKKCGAYMQWFGDYRNGIFISWYTCPSCGYDTRNQQYTWSDRTYKAEIEVSGMTARREKAINEWLDIHCRMCANNDDRGTDFVNCQAECEVQKDVGIACIHYEEYVAESEE